MRKGNLADTPGGHIRLGPSTGIRFGKAWVTPWLIPNFATPKCWAQRLFWLEGQFCSAQKLAFRYGTSDGLPQSTVNDRGRTDVGRPIVTRFPSPHWGAELPQQYRGKYPLHRAQRLEKCRRTTLLHRTYERASPEGRFGHGWRSPRRAAAPTRSTQSYG